MAEVSVRRDDGELVAGFPVLAVLALVMGIFAVGSEELVVSPLLAEVAGSFRISVAVMGLSVSVYGIGTAVGALVFAPLGDRMSRRLSLAIGMTVFVAGTVLCASAAGLDVFFAGRALAGLAAGAFVPTAYAFVGDQIPYRHRARTMGVVVSSWSLSLVLGVPVGSFVGQWAGWRSTFGLLAVLGTLVACLLPWAGGGNRPGTRHLPEGAGVPPTRQGWTRSATRALLAPKVPVYIGATFLNMLGFYGMYTYLGSALRHWFGSGSPLTGVMILVYGLGFATSFVTGRWADDLGKHKVLPILLAGLVPALAIIPLAAHLTALLAVCLFAWGSMQSLVVTLLSTLLSECSQNYRGTILSLYSLATSLAVVLGAALLGPLFAAHGLLAVGLACAAITLPGSALTAWASPHVGDQRPLPSSEHQPTAAAQEN